MKNLALIGSILSFSSFTLVAKVSESDYINVESVNYSQGSYFISEHYSSSMKNSNQHPSAYNKISRNRGMNKQNLNSFVQKLSSDLFDNVRYITDSTPIAVSSFVMLDGDLNNSDILGKQISESFVHEIYKYGIPIVDFKVMDFMRVTPDGDFIISRDFLELNADLPIQFVLIGTLVKNQTGYFVNTRIVNVRSKLVAASAQGFIPSYIASTLMSRNTRDGVRIQ